jgi:GTP-binding protein
MSLPVVAVVGRPNVGKSTLFNRILGSREAVVAEESGVTRDQHIRIGEWGDRNFLLVDTGGIIPFGVGDQFHESVSAVARDAIAHADAIILVVDVRSGITDQDLAVARELRGQENPVVLAVNKAEARRDESDVHDFHRLGLGEASAISWMPSSRTCP